MSDMPTYGKAIDPLDHGCKVYRDCQRCARFQFGQECIGEFHKYRYGEANGEKVSSLVNFCLYTLFSSVLTMQTHVNVPFASVI